MSVTIYCFNQLNNHESDSLPIGRLFHAGERCLGYLNISLRRQNHLECSEKKVFLRSSITFLYLKSNDPAATIVVAAKKKNKKWRIIRFNCRPRWMISVAVKGVIDKRMFWWRLQYLEEAKIPTQNWGGGRCLRFLYFSHNSRYYAFTAYNLWREYLYCRRFPFPLSPRSWSPYLAGTLG